MHMQSRSFWRYRYAGYILFLGLCLAHWPAWGQERVFTRQDTLRGSITPERAWWDLKFYHLTVKVIPESKRFEGHNLIRYKVLHSHQVIQIDLQEPLTLTKVTQDQKELQFRRDGNAWFITLEKLQEAGHTEEIVVYYEGSPREAMRPPWEGGVQWEKDSNDNWFIATSCQGIGASVWWPCKDHMYDEPDSMRISVNVPAGLKNVSNGLLIGTEEQSDNTVTFHWKVNNPINNYGVNLNVANYTGWQETFPGEGGALQVSYYVLPESLTAAKKQFEQVPKLLKAFEHWFGPYPFYEDGFKIVEVPYLGMEHQSSVTYGNKFSNGYLGRDLSGTGWGLKFDFILIHESAHEWFANNITYRDIAEMWIHESFTSYAEALYLEYYFGKKAASEYVIGVRDIIQNQARIMGYFGVNHKGSGDMYAKGSNMLHTIRQIIDDDELWRRILRGLNEEFYHSTVSGKQVIHYINEMAGQDFTMVFKQYLEDIRIPELEYEIKNGTLHYRWNKVMDDFAMPVKVRLGQEEVVWLHPVANQWKKREITGKTLEADPNFYIVTKKRNGLKR